VPEGDDRHGYCQPAAPAGGGRTHQRHGVHHHSQILRLLDKMNKLGNTTILIISNDIAAIANLTDTINVMYCGQMVEVGTRDQILETRTTLYRCAAQVDPRL
jgi:ABC-type antimicrobial peptide transport system ATPase subunit